MSDPRDEITQEQWDSWPGNKLLTTAQVAFMLGYEAKYARDMICRGTLPIVRCGGRHIRVRLDDLRAYIEKHHGRYKTPNKKGTP